MWFSDEVKGIRGIMYILYSTRGKTDFLND